MFLKRNAGDCVINITQLEWMVCGVLSAAWIHGTHIGFHVELCIHSNNSNLSGVYVCEKQSSHITLENYPALGHTLYLERNILFCRICIRFPSGIVFCVLSDPAVFHSHWNVDQSSNITVLSLSIG